MSIKKLISITDHELYAQLGFELFKKYYHCDMNDLVSKKVYEQLIAQPFDVFYKQYKKFVFDYNDAKKGLVYDTYNDWKFDINAKLPSVAFENSNLVPNYLITYLNQKTSFDDFKNLLILSITKSLNKDSKISNNEKLFWKKDYEIINEYLNKLNLQNTTILNNAQSLINQNINTWKNNSQNSKLIQSIFDASELKSTKYPLFFLQAQLIYSYRYFQNMKDVNTNLIMYLLWKNNDVHHWFDFNLTKIFNEQNPNTFEQAYFNNAFKLSQYLYLQTLLNILKQQKDVNLEQIQKCLKEINAQIVNLEQNKVRILNDFKELLKKYQINFDENLNINESALIYYYLKANNHNPFRF